MRYQKIRLITNRKNFSIFVFFFFILILIMDNSQEPVGNSNPPVDRRRSIGRPKSSWIWKYFDSEIRDDYKWAICKLDKLGTDIPCKKEYKTGGSTKNCIDHLLNKHNLCSDGSKDDQV